MSNIGAYDLLEATAKMLRELWSGGAKVIVAENPAHGVELLTAARQATVVLFYASDAADDNGAGILDVAVEASIRFGVVQQPGLEIKGVKPPKVLQVVDSLRKFMAGPDAVMDEIFDGWMDYKGMTYIATESGQLLNGYALTYAPRYAYEV